jgi:FkbM family methyltransferase
MNIKLIFKNLILKLVKPLGATFVGEFLYPMFAQAVMLRVRTVAGSSGLKFHVPNPVNKFRARTFLTKEPETLDWLDRIPSGSVLWDIGANVGLYTCYAASVRKCRVFAFEPSVLNLELLARNIHVNNLCSIVTIVPLPVSDKLSFSTLNMTSMELGGSMSTFKEDYGHDGLPMEALLKVPTIGLSMDEMVTLLKIPQPDFIKMDVDGIEHLILGAGGEVLRSIKEILVEINDDFYEQAEQSRRYLLDAGFKLLEKRHASEFDSSLTATATTFNQIWVKVEHV